MSKLDEILAYSRFRYSDGEIDTDEIDEAKKEIKALMLELFACEACDGKGFVKTGGKAMEDDLIETEPCWVCEDLRQKVEAL